MAQQYLRACKTISAPIGTHHESQPKRSAGGFYGDVATMHATKKVTVQGSMSEREMDAVPRFGNGAALTLPNRSVPIGALMFYRPLEMLATA